MKTKNIILALLSITLMFQHSCTDILDIEPEGAYDADGVFATDESINMYLNGLYRLMGDAKDIYGGKGYYSANMLSIDRGTRVSSAKNAQKETNEGLFNYNLTANFEIFSHFYKVSYSVIQRACVLVDRVENTDATISEELKNRYIGEARFIRALMYFNLVRFYGGMPLVTSEFVYEPGIDVNIPRATAQEVYEFIIKDLEYAANNLFVKSAHATIPSIPSHETGRVTREAAYGLLAKVYVTLGSTKRHAGHIYNASNFKYADYTWVNEELCYQSAVEWAQKLDELGTCALLNDYAMVFMTENHEESLFEIQYDNSGAVGMSGMVAYTGGPKRPKDHLQEIDRGQNRVSPYPGFTNSYKTKVENVAVLTNTYYRSEDELSNEIPNSIPDSLVFWGTRLVKEHSDFRYTWNIGTFEYNAFKDEYNEDTLVYRSIISNPKSYCYRKYRKTESLQYLDDVNFRVLRYADIVLVHAEALNELGQQNEAIALVNKIRERARNGSSYEYKPGPDPSYPASSEPADVEMGLSQDSVFQIIKQERAWELCYEGKTRFDEMRWGILEESARNSYIYENNTKVPSTFDYSPSYFVGDSTGRAVRTDELLPAAINFSMRNWLFALPQYQVDLNPNLEQNPGW